MRDVTSTQIFFQRPVQMQAMGRPQEQAVASPEQHTSQDGVSISGGARSAEVSRPRSSGMRALTVAATLMAGIGLASSLSGCAAVALGGAAYAVSESQQANRTANQALENSQGKTAAGKTTAGKTAKPAAGTQQAKDPTLLESAGSGVHKIADGFGDMGKGIGRIFSDGWHQVKDGWNQK